MLVRDDQILLSTAQTPITGIGFVSLDGLSFVGRADTVYLLDLVVAYEGELPSAGASAVLAMNIAGPSGTTGTVYWSGISFDQSDPGGVFLNVPGEIGIPRNVTAFRDEVPSLAQWINVRAVVHVGQDAGPIESEAALAPGFTSGFVINALKDAVLSVVRL